MKSYIRPALIASYAIGELTADAASCTGYWNIP